MRPSLNGTKITPNPQVSRTKPKYNLGAKFTDLCLLPIGLMMLWFLYLMALGTVPQWAVGPEILACAILYLIAMKMDEKRNGTEHEPHLGKKIIAGGLIFGILMSIMLYVSEDISANMKQLSDNMRRERIAENLRETYDTEHNITNVEAWETLPEKEKAKWIEKANIVIKQYRS